ncbi:hypothetical protein DEIPH_ctg013orf0011 [Deinococcus phoenicis]|uniref:Uncharacterized protein n=1 Tax=Deinococcus phoenicis TaxID=1476583 RepID=A0A016QSY7_9DEIO|nr:hypothetical protein [Deinococcus phoenicis]EYB68909.1 hypothetical protein DEIPH_ctg013orf0011 [Deinococcus phoenicis]
MKQTQLYTVRAYRTETKYNAKDDLISLLDVQVPADALEFLRAAHNAQDSKDVTFTVQVTDREDGEFRKLAFTSKGSKMKDFVPVATLEKWHNSHDNLTELFDHVTYELALIVQVRELQEGPGLFEEEQPEAVAAGVLNAPKEVLALPAPEVEDAEFQDWETTARALLAACGPAQLAELLAALGLPALPAAAIGEEQEEARRRLLKVLHVLDGTALLKSVQAEVEAIAAFLARCSMKHLADLLEEAGYDPTSWDDPKRTDDEDMAEWREIIRHHWAQLQGTETFEQVRQQVEGEGHAAAAD